LGGNEEGDFRIEVATETATHVCEAKRAAVWRLSGDGRALSCENSYDAATKDHTEGLTLHRDEFPALFTALDEGRVIDTIGNAGDKRVIEIVSNYLRPLGIEHIYMAPIMRAGRPLGMLEIEDPQHGGRSADMVAFCDALASLLALRMGGMTTAGTASKLELQGATPLQVQDTSGSAPADAFVPRQARLEEMLIRNNISWAGLAETALTRAVIGIAKLPDWVSVARRPPDSGARTEMDMIVRELRAVIERSDLSYATQLDDQIVIAAYSADEKMAARDAASVAMALLEMRDRLVALEEKWETSLDFRFAIDVGTVMHSTVAGDAAKRNLWGGSIGIARILAAATTSHTIAASETAYELLSAHFLLRPRGTYFLPETGMMRTFVMVGAV
jgi:hypothetical protein